MNLVIGKKAVIAGVTLILSSIGGAFISSTPPADADSNQDVKVCIAEINTSLNHIKENQEKSTIKLDEINDKVETMDKSITLLDYKVDDLTKKNEQNQ